MKQTDESIHFDRCRDCGQLYDMRDLGQVFRHEHRRELNPNPVFKSSVKKDVQEAIQWKDGKEPIHLN